MAREAAVLADTYGADGQGGEPPPERADLGRRLLFTLGALVLYRLGTYIPVPGLNPHVWHEIFAASPPRIFTAFEMLSGGALSRMTLFALGITPYLSASIVLQLAIVVSAGLRALKNGGEAGRQRLDRYARIGALILAAIQAYGIAIGLEGVLGGRPLVIEPGLAFRLTTVATLTAGTALLMWLSEQITTRGVGNGIMLIILSGLVAQTPGGLGELVEMGRTGVMSSFAVMQVLSGGVVLVAFVVFMERARRNILVQWPRRQVGEKMFGGQASSLSLKLNSAGVIPPLFAASLSLLPAAFGFIPLSQAKGYAFWGHPPHILLYVVLTILFCLFYTAIVFSPAEMADKLEKHGGFVPGIRPGKNTADYLDYVLTRLSLVGALYVAGVCVLPEILAWRLGFTLYFGGTSLLVLVCVTLDFFGEIGARLRPPHVGTGR